MPKEELNPVFQSAFYQNVLMTGFEIYKRIVFEYGDKIKTGVNIDDIGSAGEQKIKKVIDMVYRLEENTSELNLAILFLNIDVTKIKCLYGNNISAEEYTNYNFDNFRIRLATCLDLCGKIGNLVYDRGIDERVSNAGTFLQFAKKNAPHSEEKLRELQTYLKVHTAMRHLKVHQGISKENAFKGVVFWSAIGESIGNTEMVIDPVLQKFTQGQVLEVIADLVDQLEEKNRLVVAYLDTLTPQYNELLTTVETKK